MTLIMYLLSIKLHKAGDYMKNIENLNLMCFVKATV